MKWWLVIHEHPHMCETVMGLLEQEVEGEVVRVAHLSAAQEAFNERGRNECSLIVSSLSAPCDGDTPLAIDRGVITAPNFVASIRGRGETPPCVFLASYADSARVEEVSRMPSVAFVQVKDMHKTLAGTVRDFRRPLNVAASERLPHEVDIDITLKVGGLCKWTVMPVCGGTDPDAGVIEVSPDTMRRLVTMSGSARGGDHAFINQLGRDFYEHLLSSNLKSGLELAMRNRIRDPRYLEAARIRVNVDAKSYGLLVETIAKPRALETPDDLDFWMLRTPIFRKYGSHGDRLPLYKDRKSRKTPVECLIIVGTHTAFSAGGKVVRGFPAISSALDEANWLESYLSENHQSFQLVAPRIVRPGDQGTQAYGDRVRSVLSERPWQLIHYVGHSAIGRDRYGYLALGDGPRDLLRIDEFAQRASSAQFVFLNSCRSAGPDFIKSLAASGVPAVAGYAWPIDDEVALKFCMDFYSNLFEGELSRRFIEYSFMRAKRQLHEDYTEAPLWAAPLLFMQLLAAERD